MNIKLKESEVAQACPTLCGPMDCRLPGSSVHGIFQARVLEWVAISFSRGSSQPRDQTWVSHIVDRRLPSEPPGKSRKKEFNLLQGKNSTFLEAWEKETSNRISKIIIIIKRQRNATQFKEQTRNTEVQINEEEIGKLPEKEFRIMIVKTFKAKWKEGKIN